MFLRRHDAIIKERIKRVSSKELNVQTDSIHTKVHMYMYLLELNSIYENLQVLTLLNLPFLHVLIP